MKKLLIAALLLLFATPAFAGGTNYVLMALQPTTVDNFEVYTLVNGAQTYNIPASYAVVVAESGAWDMVLFLLETIKPDSWTHLQAAEWLSGADGFLAFDYRMLAEYARADMTIQGRTFDYDTVLDTILVYEWWVSDGEGGYTHSTGSKADYIAGGYPSKLVRVKPMTKFLGVSE